MTESITHLILVTCTGFFAPGLDIAISDELNLAPEVEQIQIGFMGCSALFNAWRTAAAIVTGAPEARVLIVCVEVCSIHLLPSLKRQHLISAALFSDGSGSVRHRRPLGGRTEPRSPNEFLQPNQAQYRERNDLEDRRPRIRAPSLPPDP